MNSSKQYHVYVVPKPHRGILLFWIITLTVCIVHRFQKYNVVLYMFISTGQNSIQWGMTDSMPSEDLMFLISGCGQMELETAFSSNNSRGLFSSFSSKPSSSPPIILGCF